MAVPSCRSSSQMLSGPKPDERDSGGDAMKNAIRRATLLLTLLACGGQAQAEGLFDGRGAEAWVVNRDTGTLLPVDTGDWLLDFTDAGAQAVPFASPEEVLINNLAASSERMTPGQPAISLTGMRPAALSLNEPQRSGDLRIWPVSGEYRRTIELQVGVAPSRLAQGSVEIDIAINGSGVASLLLCGSGQEAGCEDGAVVREGYRGWRDVIVRDGSYRVSATLKAPASAIEARTEVTLNLASNDPLGFRRDTDGDGIPDLIEREIGLDALRADFDRDVDGDGWSDFDEWLREDTLHPEGCDRDEESCVPRDSDNDGWSDFDEQLRGTRTDDPDPLLPPREDEAVFVDVATGQVRGSGEAYRQRTLRYKQRPAARRLYEVEHRLSGELIASAEAPVGRWIDLAAQALDGFRAWSLDALLDEAALEETPLGASQFSSEILRSNAARDLDLGALPTLRLSAGVPAVVQAFGQAGRNIYVYKHFLTSHPDATLVRFLETDPQWESAADWKQQLIAWLGDELVVDAVETIDWPATRNVVALEQILSEEAFLAGEAVPVLFNDRIPVAERIWLTALQEALNEAGRSFDVVINDLDSALAPAGILREVADFIDAQVAPSVLPVGQMSDVWLAARFADSQQLTLEDCLIPADILALLEAGSSQRQELEDRCPVIYTEADVLAGLRNDRSRRYQLRTLLFTSAAQLVANPELLDPLADSDGDGTDNETELGRFPFLDSGAPGLADSDGDGIPDGEDLCPRDIADLCLGLPSEPQLLADAEGRVIEADGALAVIGVYLDRRVTFPVTASWQALAGPSDTATPGDDFAAISGTLTIPIDQQLALVAVPIVGDALAEADETFRIRVTDVDGAQSAIPASGVPVTIVDGVSARDLTAVAQAPAVVDERDRVILDGTASRDSRGPLAAFAWQQLSGPTALLDNAATDRAAFNAPVVTTATDLRFELKVTASDGAEARDTVDVQVRPLDDAPVVTGPPLEFTVAQGDTLRVEDTTIFTAVDEPDGEPLSFLGTQGQPDGGRLSVDATGFDFAAFGGEKRLSDRAASRLTLLANGRAAFVGRVSSLSAGSSEAVFVYDASSRTVREIYNGTDSVLGLSADAQRDELYFQSGSFGSAIQQFRHGGGLRTSDATDADFSSSSALVDPISGDLIYCGQAGQWRRLDADNLTAATGATACSSAFGQSGESIPRTLWGDAFCFADESRVYCAEEGGSVALLDDFGFRIQDLRTLGDQLLLMGYDGTDGTVQLIQPDGRLGYLRKRPSKLAPRLLDLPGDYVGIAEGDGDSIRLIAMDVTGEEYELIAPMMPFATRFDLGGLARDGYRLLWFVALDQDTWVLLQLDLDEAAMTPTPLGEPVSQATFARPLLGQVPPVPISRPDGVAVMTRHIDTGRCTWQLVTPLSDLRELVSDIDCSQNASLANELLYRRIDSADFTRRQHAFDGEAFLGRTGLTAQVADPGGQSVDVRVGIEIVSPSIVPMATPTPTSTPTATATPTPTPTATATATPTTTATPTPTTTATATPTSTPTASATTTPTATTSPSPTPSASTGPSPTPSASPSPTPTASVSQTPSISPFPFPSPSATPGP